MTEVSEIGIVALETAEASAAAVLVVEQPAAGVEKTAAVFVVWQTAVVAGFE